ncbi:hypothetical protein BEN30_09335 [Magnetovibrio blakemorei]|uniref:DNA-binding domain-containing protein n=2 Tax=Magnetovibrio blakemorei TaxID=28181 RepID=A0A1E5Q8N7_9PROT|nr:hypothetical protein BEN30_09335 [Magnetovibrio blakemorei]
MIENAEQVVQVNDIRTFLKSYKTSHTDTLNPVIRSQYQQCLTRCEQEVFDPATRREPFKRVISARIADLFPTSPEADKKGGSVSRRMLPGLFAALEKMVGGDFFSDGDRICTDLAEELKRRDQFFLWEDLYTSEQAQDAVDDLLMALVPHFSDPMKRVTWMVRIINADLASPKEYYFEGATFQDWVLDEDGMIEILRHLFRHLKHQMTIPELAKKVATKYGMPAAHALLALINELDHTENYTEV